MSDETKKQEQKVVPFYKHGKYSEYQRIMTNRYNKENYKTITVRFRSSEEYNPCDVIRAAAELSGTSINNFCVQTLLKTAYELLENAEENKSEN